MKYSKINWKLKTRYIAHNRSETGFNKTIINL